MIGHSATVCVVLFVNVWTTVDKT